jgi:hypothetical protein
VEGSDCNTTKIYIVLDFTSSGSAISEFLLVSLLSTDVIMAVDCVV